MNVDEAIEIATSTAITLTKLEMAEVAEVLANEVERLRKVLETIVDPIKFLRIEAEQKGLKINGMMASMLSNDANYLKEIAEKGLKNES